MIKEGSNLMCEENWEKYAARIVLQCWFPHAYSSNPVSSEFSSIATEVRSQSAETIYFRKEVVKNVKKSKEIVAKGGLKALHAGCRFIYSCLATVVTVCFRLPVTESNIQQSKYCTHIKENSVKKIVNKRLRKILVVRNTLSHVPPVPFVRLRVASKKKNVISSLVYVCSSF